MSFIIDIIKKVSEFWFGGSDCYRIFYTIYVIGGLWMLRTKHIERNIYMFAFFRFAQIFSVIGAILCSISFIYDAYAIRKNIEKLAYNLGVTIFVLMTFLRFLCMALKRDDFEEMYDSLNRNLDLEDVGTSERDRNVFKEGEETLKRIGAIFYVLMVCGLTAKILCHIVTEKSLPIPFPIIPELQTPIYEILFTCQAIALPYFVGVVIAQELVFYGVFIRVLAHLFILTENITNLESIASEKDISGVLMSTKMEFNQFLMECELKWKQEKIFNMLKKNIIHHQKIVRVLRETKFIMKESFFVQFFGSALLLVDLFFHVILQTSNSPLMMLCQFVYSTTTLLDITILCYYGSEIQDKSEKAARSLHSIDWLDIDLKNKQTLDFFQKALWKPPVIKAGNVFPVNLNIYLKFLNSIYSMLAFLHNTLKRN